MQASASKLAQSAVKSGWLEQEMVKNQFSERRYFVSCHLSHPRISYGIVTPCGSTGVDE